MVREYEARWADEGAGAAVIDPHARQAKVVEPLLGGCETVLLLQLLDGRIVECPHDLFGAAEGERGAKQDDRSHNGEVAQLRRRSVESQFSPENDSLWQLCTSGALPVRSL